VTSQDGPAAGTSGGDAGAAATPAGETTSGRALRPRAGAADPTPAHFRRLHPLTPLLRGWAWLAGAVAFGGQDAIRAGDPGRFALFLPVIALVGFGVGLASWWFTRYGFDGDALRIDSGILQRRSRRVRLDRLQAVDVVRPLAGRLLGVSELRLEVAGGTTTEAPLAYLSADDAVRLRAELLARAAGIDAETPEAPERVAHEVPPGRLLGSTILSGTFVIGVVLLISLGGAFVVGGHGIEHQARLLAHDLRPRQDHLAGDGIALLRHGRGGAAALHERLECLGDLGLHQQHDVGGDLGERARLVEVGRVVDLEVESTDPATARAEVERMCEQLLANPLIESYEIELEGPG